MLRIISITLAFLLDIIFGDPEQPFHPVRLMGKLISFLEKILRRIFPENPTGERIAGGILVFLTCTVSTGAGAGILYILYRWNIWAYFLGETFFCYQLLAMKSLKTESMKVYKALKEDDTEKARKAVSMIVGRDTKPLDKTGIIKAAVETVAENASDGVAAPLMYMMLFGAAGGFFYKSVNTMDSMVGYKNSRFLYFGTAAAKTDDILNFIPARICGIFMIVSAGILKYDRKESWRIFLRDRKNHASPNSAQGEAAMAGALRVQLAGPAWYFGKLIHKLTIGDDTRPIEAEDIVRANRMLYVCGFLSLLCFDVFFFLVWLLQAFYGSVWRIGL